MSKKHDPKIVITAAMVNFSTKRSSYTVRSNHPYFKEIKAALKDLDTGTAYRLYAKKQSDDASASGECVKVVGNHLEFDGKKFHESFAEAYALSQENGAGIEALNLFFQRLAQNPNPISLHAFTSFMAKTRMPLTDRRTWLAYKRVDWNFLDHHSQKWDNRPGFAMAMDRKDVDAIQSNTCSTGFHVCSHTYLSHFSNGIDLVVEIDPRDVVAVPPDYDLSKMRLSSYRVLCTLPFFKERLESRWQDALGNIPFFHTDQMSSWSPDLGCNIMGADRPEKKGEVVSFNEWSEQRDRVFAGLHNPSMASKA